MLDNEPTGGFAEGSDPDADAQKTAPAKRVTRRKKAVAAEEPTTDTSSVPAEEPAPKKRATRTRRKTTADEPETTPDAEAQPVTEQPTAQPTATRRTRRRAPAIAEPEPDVSQVPEVSVAPEAEEPTDEPEPSTLPNWAAATTASLRATPPGPPTAAVMFMAPDPFAAPPVPPAVHEETAEAPPARRTRTRRKPDSDEAPPSPTPTADEPDESDEDEPTDELDTDSDEAGDRRRRRRGRRGRGRGRGSELGDDEDLDTADSADTAEPAGSADTADEDTDSDDAEDTESDAEGGTRRRRRRRRRTGTGADVTSDDPPNTVVKVREPHLAEIRSSDDEVQGIKGSTRMEAKRQRRRDGREQRRRPPVLTEAEFLARREAVNRVMVVRQRGERTQIAVLEDDVLVEHYVTKASSTSYAGNVYLGRVQNVLPSMEAAFVDIGKGRNGVLYAGEVNWDSVGMEGQPRKIEQALKSGDSVLVQVTKDPIGHKGARLTSQISLPGRFLVYVPEGQMTGISRKLPDTERKRLKDILKRVVPEDAGVIIRTAAEGATEEELANDVARLQTEWEEIKARAGKGGAPALLHAEPDLVIRVIRDIFNEDFSKMVVQGDLAWKVVEEYVGHVSPDLAERLEHRVGEGDVFHDLRIDEQILKGLDRKVWLPSGGSLIIDRTEAMTVVDVNTGKFTGQGGNLEETVTRNNLEAAEEIVRQLRLRDIGGIIVIDFIDMVLEGNRDLVLRRLTECLGRDRTKHQVAEVTSLGLVQMTRKRVGQGLLEAFSEPCEHCRGRGIIVHTEPVEHAGSSSEQPEPVSAGEGRRGKRRGRGGEGNQPSAHVPSPSAVAAAIRNGHHDEEPEPSEDVADDTAQVEPPAQPEPDAVDAPTAQEQEPAPDQEPEPEPAPARPVRRRRAASRPAGPPVPAS